MVVGADGHGVDPTLVTTQATPSAICQRLTQGIFGGRNAPLARLHSDLQRLDSQKQAALRMAFEYHLRLRRQLARGGNAGLPFGSVTFRSQLLYAPPFLLPLPLPQGHASLNVGLFQRVQETGALRQQPLGILEPPASVYQQELVFWGVYPFLCCLANALSQSNVAAVRIQPVPQAGPMTDQGLVRHLHLFSLGDVVHAGHYQSRIGQVCHQRFGRCRIAPRWHQFL